MDYSRYQDLKIHMLEPGIAEIVMGEEGGKLSTAGHRMHAELAEIWRDIDRDPEIRVVIIRGAGKGFSAGGDLSLVQDIADDFAVRARVWREARDLVYNVINCDKPIVSAMHGPAVGAGLVAGLLADIYWPRAVQYFGAKHVVLRYAYAGDRFVNRDMVSLGLALSRAYAPDTARPKTSIVFSLPNEAGSLFKALSAFALRGVTLRNRIGISPMCQYSAVDGDMNDWHQAHLGSLALSGAGMLCIEATAVTPEGRITPGCPGLFATEHEAQWKRLVDFVHAETTAKICCQIGHAGRKASVQVPWEDNEMPLVAGGWDRFATVEHARLSEYVTATSANTEAVSATCTLPRPNTARRSAHRRVGCNSRPMTNSRNSGSALVSICVKSSLVASAPPTAMAIRRFTVSTLDKLDAGCLARRPRRGNARKKDSLT